MTLFVPNSLPEGLSIWFYSFGYNRTHGAIPLDYGSLLNHHKSANTHAVPDLNNNMHFQVRGFFQCANHNSLKIGMRACTNMCIHTHAQQMHVYT